VRGIGWRIFYLACLAAKDTLSQDSKHVLLCADFWRRVGIWCLDGMMIEVSFDGRIRLGEHGD
jgi:hypothetical protein